ncbi:MAG: ATP-dependent helicase, partial [Georgfuchsia sp.]
MVQHLADLNEDQREAALHDGHCLITACPGSGKTRTLAAKAVHILASTSAATVCAVTYTRESALEIRERIVRVLIQTIGDEAARAARARLLTGTFHSLCFMQPAPMVSKEGYGAAILSQMRTGGTALARTTIATEGDRRGYLIRAMELARLSDMTLEGGLRVLEAVKARLVPPDKNDRTPGDKLFHAYQDILNRNGKIDFQDIVLRAVRGLKEGSVLPFPADYLLVDEFQDTDELQYEWMREHARAGTRITAVGDDDQSIYAFRSAMGYAGMEKFAQEWDALHVVLGVNYRCHAEILDSSDRLIRNNIGRITKNLIAAKGHGGSSCYMVFEDAEAEGIAVTNCAAAWRAKQKLELAVIARTNRRLDHVEASLTTSGIPFVRTGGGSILDKEEVSVFADIISLVCETGFAGLDHVLSWAGVTEEDLRVLHKDLGKSLIAAKKAELERLDIGARSVDLWWEFGKKLKSWREAAERGKEFFVIASIRQWMESCADNDAQVRMIGLAATVFGGIKSQLPR